jgi:hypothetical protein
MTRVTRVPRLALLLTLATVLVVAPTQSRAQFGQPARRVISGATLPTRCTSSVLIKDVFYKTGAGAGLYVCTAGPGTWTAVGGGGSGDALTSDPLSQFASTTSAQLAGVISNETGTGLLVFATSPVFTTPNIGAATGSITGNAGTASALAANGTNCSAGNYPLGVDASGNSEDCTVVAAGDVAGPASSTDNAITRFDGTGGKTLQNSDLTVADVAGASIAVATTAGNALTITATAPTATTGASQAGKSISITSSPAVASTDTAGAAAGANITYTAGAAARNTSGNSDGGDHVFVGGLGIGTGVKGDIDASGVRSILIADGSSSVPSLRNSTNAGLYTSSGLVLISDGSQPHASFATGSLTIQSDNIYRWSNSSSSAGGTADTGLSRLVAGVVAVGTGAASARDGWMQWAGQCYVASDQTNVTTTLASTTCSITVLATRKYAFTCSLFLSDSLAADGAKVSFGGGTATETNFRAQVTAFDSALNLSTQLDDLTDVASAATFTGDGNFEVHGSFESNGAGTWIPQFAQAAHTTGTLTLYRGSNCRMWDMP